LGSRLVKGVGSCRAVHSNSIFQSFQKKENIMRILFINNHGGGFASHLEVTEGTTVQQLFEKQIPGGKASDFLIRVNRQPTSSGQVLQELDRVSITPTKIEGGFLIERDIHRAKSHQSPSFVV